MKRTAILALILALVLCALTLTACAKSEFGVTTNTEKHMTIDAVNADKDDSFMVGTLEAAEGEQVTIAANLKSGSIRVELVAADTQDGDKLPETDGNAIITANLVSTDSSTGTVPAGSYMIRATCLEKATGTVEINLEPAA